MAERNGYISANLCLVSKNPMSVKPAIFSVGGFTAKSKDGREFHFDWDDQETSCEIIDGHVFFNTHLKTFNDGVYEEMNKENGVEQLEITPEFIKDSSLTELYYECYMTDSDEVNMKCEELELVMFNIIGEVNGETQNEFFPGDKIKEWNKIESENRKEA